MRQAAAAVTQGFKARVKAAAMQPQDCPESGQPRQMPKTPVADMSLEAAEHLSSCQDGPVRSKAVNTVGRATAHHKTGHEPAADLSSEVSEHASVCQDGLAGVKHLLLEGVI